MGKSQRNQNNLNKQSQDANRRSSSQPSGGLTFVDVNDLMSGMTTIPGVPQTEADAIAAQARAARGMGTDQPASTTIRITTQDILQQGYAYNPSSDKEADLPAAVWLMAAALELCHLTGMSHVAAAEVMASNQTPGLMARSEGFSIFQLTEFAALKMSQSV